MGTPEQLSSGEPDMASEAVPPLARRAAARSCGWCGGPITLRSRGPVPKWCSPTCRHRNWEQQRAAASGLAAVRIVERVVERVVTPPPPPPATPTVPRHGEWADLLQELARQLDQGLVHDCDLAQLAPPLDDLLTSFRRRLKWG